MTTVSNDGLRACSKCGERKCWPASFRSGTSATCKTCWGVHQKAWADANRATLKEKAKARREAAAESRRAARAKWQNKDRAQERDRLRALGGSPFDITLRELVPQWGEYSRWTREQHAQHTEILRRMARIADDAPQPESHAA